jgi:hypothetical protein
MDIDEADMQVGKPSFAKGFQMSPAGNAAWSRAHPNDIRGWSARTLIAKIDRRAA